MAFIACGGTIGGEWSPKHDTVIPSRHGNQRLFEYLYDSVHLHRKITTVDLFNKDSRAITDTDRDKIFRKILLLRRQGIRYFLITHGTFTMQQSALYISKRLNEKGITDLYITFVGAMIPNSGFAPSDAQFNIGFSMAKLTSLTSKEQAGVWISMNGLFGRHECIRKNVKAAKFEAIR